MIHAATSHSFVRSRNDCGVEAQPRVVAFKKKPSRHLGKPVHMGGFMRIVFASVLLAGTFALVGGQPVVSQQAGAVKPPFSLTISYNPKNPAQETSADQIVKAGSWLTFLIRKTNIADHEIPVRPHGCLLQYDVRDSSGSPVAHRKSKDPSGIVRMEPAGQPRMLQPGESKVIFEDVGNWYEMDKPGIYAVQVSQCLSDDPASDVVKSNALTITVLPADSPQPTQ